MPTARTASTNARHRRSATGRTSRSTESPEPSSTVSSNSCGGPWPTNPTLWRTPPRHPRAHGLRRHQRRRSPRAPPPPAPRHDESREKPLPARHTRPLHGHVPHQRRPSALPSDRRQWPRRWCGQILADGPDATRASHRKGKRPALLTDVTFFSVEVQLISVGLLAQLLVHLHHPQHSRPA